LQEHKTHSRQDEPTLKSRRTHSNVKCQNQQLKSPLS